MKHTVSIVALLVTLFGACAATPPATAAPSWPAATAPRATPPARAPDLEEDPDLRELLALALERNPRVRAARERSLASRETGAIDGALPDPKLLLGWYAAPVETRVGPQEWSLGIQQSIPFPSRLRDRRRLGDTLAQRDELAYERTVRDVLVEVVQVAHELIYIDDAIAISGRIAPLLERYVAEGAEPLSEHFRAGAQRAQLDHDRVVLAELRTVEEERLRALLDLPPHLPVGTPRAAGVPRVTADLDGLWKIARAHNQELREAGVEVKAAALRTGLARQRRLPDLTVGYTHIVTGDQSPAIGNPPGNGDDAGIVHLGITLPLWAGKNRAAIRRARALERMAVAGRRESASMLRTRLARAWFQVGNAQRLIDLYGEILVPRAEIAARTAEDLQAAGKGSLAGTLETVAVLHNFRLAAARARADHAQAVAALEAILGQPLERTPR